MFWDLQDMLGYFLEHALVCRGAQLCISFWYLAENMLVSRGPCFLADNICVSRSPNKRTAYQYRILTVSKVAFEMPLLNLLFYLDNLGPELSFRNQEASIEYHVASFNHDCDMCG